MNACLQKARHASNINETSAIMKSFRNLPPINTRKDMRSRLQAWIITALIIAGCLLISSALFGGEQKKSTKKPLATLDGIVITETQARAEGASELESLDLKIAKSRANFAMDEHQILDDAVERLIEERLLQAEATRQGISKDELLAKEIKQKVQGPTKEEIDAFYEANQQRINKPKEEIAAKISDYLKKQTESEVRQAFIEKLEKEHKVVRSLEPLRFSVDAKVSPSIGPAAAPVVLVLFSDFQCPYCKGMSATLKEVTKKYGDKVRLVFRQFPLTNIHPFAQGAAEASLCAAAQGRFWEMHDLLFQNQKSLSVKDFKSHAEKLGLDTAAFNACVDSKRFAPQVKEDLKAGAGAGTEGTPALYINGRFLNGNRPFEQIAEIIDEELKGKTRERK
jgi:protein-disulfide isomerase